MIKEQLSSANGKIFQGWSVRKLEQAVKKAQKGGEGITHEHAPDVAAFERMISKQIGAEVKLETESAKGSGWLKIKYYDLRPN